jgi:hypothetical protein
MTPTTLAPPGPETVDSAIHGYGRPKQRPLPPERDHRITLAAAVDLTHRHQREHPDEGAAGYFFRAAFDVILAQVGCAAIRIYRGKAADGSRHFVLVGATANGRDISEGAVMEQDWPCPPFCAVGSPLLAAAPSVAGRKLPEFHDHRISLEAAAEMTRRHREDHPDQPHAGLFARKAINTLLAQAACVGVRIYRGVAPDGTRHFVLVSANKEGKDLTIGALMEQDWPCPPFCSVGSPLLE